MSLKAFDGPFGLVHFDTSEIVYVGRPAEDALRGDGKIVRVIGLRSGHTVEILETPENIKRLNLDRCDCLTCR